MVRLPKTNSINAAFTARARLEQILLDGNVKIRGQTLTVRLDADQERKDGYRLFFATWRAVQAEVPAEALGYLKEEPRVLVMVHHGCRANLPNLAKHSGQIVWNQSVLVSLGITKETIQRRMADLA